MDEYSLKLSNKLQVFEKNSKEWEWSDLIKWLSDLKQIIDRYSLEIPNDQINLLSKRLSQCLYPSLPHGLHSKTLEIYYLLLSETSLSQVSLLSTGLFPHFQFCAPQNKPQFLELISKKYIQRFEKIDYLLQGLISCLLTGANDTPDTFAKVSEIIDNCIAKNKIATHNVLWWFILKSHRHRLAGLLFMQKKIDREISEQRIINSLLEALSDSSVIIRRNTLDLIRISYPLALENVQNMVILMQGALKLLRSKDHTLLRRIWEWAFPDELDQKQIQIVTQVLSPAVINIFNENKKEIQQGLDNDDAKELSIKIVETLNENEGISEVILSNIAIDIVKHTVNEKLYVVHNKSDCRIKNIFTAQNSRIFWKSFEKNLGKVLVENEEETFKILEFAIKNFEFSVDSFPSIFFQLFSKISEIKNISVALPIFISLLDNIDIVELDVSDSVLIYEDFLKANSFEILSNFTILYGNLINKGIKVPKVSKMLKKYTENDFLSGVSLLIKLGTHISQELLRGLWNHVSTESHITACELLTGSFFVCKEEWDLSTISLLLHSDIAIQEKYMRKFISFWAHMEKNHSEKLDRLARDSKIVFIMIDQLGSENPITKHLATEWLCTAQCTIKHVLDPVLKIMLNKNTVREINSDGFYCYISLFDAKRIEDSIAKVILVICNGGKSVIEQIKTSKISPHVLQKCFKHSIHATSYLSLLINIMILYIQTPTNSEFIHGKSTELLSLIVKDLPNELINYTLNACSEGVSKYLQKDSEIEMCFLKVFENLFSNKVVFCYNSKFSEVLIEGIKNEKKEIRVHWMKFINTTLPSILNSISVPELTIYLKSLFEKYYEIIMLYLDFSMINGLSVLINFTLNINNKTQIHLIHAEVKEMIKNQIDKILMICLKFYENLEENAHHNINLLITPTASMFQPEFIEGLLILWKKLISQRPKSQDLQLIVKMTPNFNISPDIIIENIVGHLQILPKDSKDDLFIASFVQNLLNVLENFKIPFSSQSLWTRVLLLLRHYSQSIHKESLIFQMSFVCILTKKIPPDPKFVKEIQEILKNITLSCYESLKWTTSAAEIGYFSTDFISESICEKMLRTLITHSAFLYDFYFASQEKKKIELISGLLNHLLIEIPNHENGGELIGTLFDVFIRSFSTKLAELIKSNLLEFYKANLFTVLKRYPKSLYSWGSVINTIATKFYSEQANLLIDLMYHFEPSFWYTTSTVLSLLYRSTSLMTFIIFSSPKKAYSNAVAGIMNKIKEILRIGSIDLQILRPLCLLIKTLYVRLPSKEFNTIWQVVWNDLHILFLKYLHEISLFETFEVLKFLDFMLATGFQNSSLIFFYLFDVPEIELITEEKKNFKPAATTQFLSGYSVEPSKAKRKHMINHSQSKRKLQISQFHPEDVGDLEMFVKTLIQFCSLYASENISTDWESIETCLGNDIANLI